MCLSKFNGSGILWFSLQNFKDKECLNHFFSFGWETVKEYFLKELVTEFDFNSCVGFSQANILFWREVQGWQRR